jgi:hypothetical protein
MPVGLGKPACDSRIYFEDRPASESGDINIESNVFVFRRDKQKIKSRAALTAILLSPVEPHEARGLLSGIALSFRWWVTAMFIATNYWPVNSW